MRAVVTLAAGALAAVAVTAFAPPATPRAHACVLTWTVSPSPEVRDGRLAAVAATSPTDAWAVGEVAPWEGADTRPGSSVPLVEHWDGASWTIVATDGARGSLLGVAGSASDDVWAVGQTPSSVADGWPAAFATATAANTTLIEHWDGRAWTRAPLTKSGGLNSVAVAGRRQAWAVGGVWRGFGKATGLIVHWDGTRWTVAARAAWYLRDVAVVTPRNVWAVGDGVAMQWNGSRWRSFRMPNRVGHSIGRPQLVGITTVTAKDIWAVGSADLPSDSYVFAKQPVVMHWNGRRWTDRSPTLGAIAYSVVSDLAVLPADETWLAATDENQWLLGPLDGAALYRRQNGWKPLELGVGQRVERLAVDASPALWAAGYSALGDPSDELYGAFDHTTPLIQRRGC